MNTKLQPYLLVALVWVFSLAFFKVSAQDTSGCAADVVLRTQAEVNAFNCTQVRSLTLVTQSNNAPDPITDLSPFSSLTAIEEDLNLEFFSLEKVTGGLGLINLASIGGDFKFSGNSFQGLERLEQIGGSFFVGRSANNPNFEGLEQLKVIGGGLYTLSTRFRNFQGLSNLKTIKGRIAIRFALQGVSFQGLSSLESAGGFAFYGSNITNFKGLNSLQPQVPFIYIEESGVTSFEGLENVTEITGDITLQDGGVSSWKGLGNLRRIGGNLSAFNSNTSSFVNLENLAEIGGKLNLDGGSLTNFEGLRGLRSVKSITLFAVGSLISLDGIQDLKINGGFFIYDTPIEDISALKNVKEITGDLTLDDNSRLSTCCVIPAIADRVQGSIIIENNEPGCNSLEEITNRCEGPESGLFYAYYEIDERTSRLPLYDFRTPVKTGTIANFSLSPAERADYFGFVQSGYLNITQAGAYTFYVNSDDGAKLHIDNKLVVDNDGRHSVREASGTVTLTEGRYPIRVDYFEAFSVELLEVRYAGPGISKQLIPDNALFVNNEAPTSPAATDFWLEAECAARVGSAWQTVDDASASGNRYLEVKAGSRSTQQAPTDPETQISFDVSASQAGQYALYSRHLSFNGQDDSFWVRVNGKPWVLAYLGANRGSFVWARTGGQNNTFALSAGTNTVTIALREPDARLDKLFLTLKGNLPTALGGTATNCMPPDVVTTNVWLEAECADRIGAFWSLRDDPTASQGNFLQASAEDDNYQGDTFIPSRNITFRFSVSEAGQYRVFSRHLSYDGLDDSFWYRINGGPLLNAYLGANRGSFTWAQLGNNATYPLRVGANTITIVLREPNARLDKLFITLDGDKPNGTGEAASNCQTNARVATASSDRSLTEETLEVPASLRAYPIPADRTLSVQFTDASEAGDLILTDLSGKEMRHLAFPDGPSSNQVEINTQDIPAGVYLLRWRGAHPYREKLLIAH